MPALALLPQRMWGARGEGCPVSRRVFFAGALATLLLAFGLAGFIFSDVTRPAPTPTATPAAQATAWAGASAAASPTASAQLTPAAQPTATAPPTATARPTAPPTPAATVIATATKPAPAGAPPAPATVPTQADGAGALLAQGRELQRNGDDAAIETYRLLIARFPQSAAAAEAQYRLGESLLANGRQDAAALQALQAFLRSEAPPALVRPALALAAQAQRRLGNRAEAIELYRRYLANEDLIPGYIQRQIAAIFVEMGQQRDAIAAYEVVVNADLPAEYVQAARRSLAELYGDLKEWDQAIVWWQRFADATSSGSDKALSMARSAAMDRGAGRADAANSTLRRLVDAYPATSYAAEAMDSLLKQGVAIPIAQQGLVSYYNRRNEQAIALYDRYLAETPDGEAAPLIRYRLGILYQRLGRWDDAIAALKLFHDLHPNNDLARDAWLEVARTLVLAGKPGDGAEFYERVANWYPSSTEAEQSLWEGGLTYYRIGRFAIAAQLLARLQQGFPKSGYLTRAIFWQGKALLAAGQTGQGAQVLAELAANRRPEFYLIRARQILQALPGGQQGTLVFINRESDERATFMTWLTGWAGPDQGLNVNEDVHVRRGDRLLQLHMPTEAAAEFVLARARYWNDAWGMHNLMMRFRANRQTYDAIIAATRLFNLSPSALPDTPRYLWRMMYPTDYAGLIGPEAERNGLDPMWLYALIRQESGYNPFAASWAGAWGLTQFIPSTAQDTARRLGVPDFRMEDMNKPVVSIRFGAWYAAQQIKAAGGNTYIGLAGYNGGLGNAQRWAKGLAPFDLDLFVENVGFNETQNYVRLLYQYYYVYQTLWG